MDAQNAQMFITMNSKYFNSSTIPAIYNHLLKADTARDPYLFSLQFKDPVLLLVVSFLVGFLGIDRMLIGDVGLGIAKLLTCGGCGIWAIIDIILIMDATKQKILSCFRKRFQNL